jgi:hypothetical protein
MKKTQTGWIFIILITAFTIYGFLSSGFTRGNTFWILASLLIILLLFYNLTITVDDHFVRFSFGIGIIRGKFALSEIDTCRPKTYIALGWGIRLRPGVIIYNVSGNKAIELKIKGKKRYVWIGTNSPEELCGYIHQRMNQI